MSGMEGYPEITIGIITLNREWSIGAVIESIKRQDYPHSKIHVLVVDGGSKDRTVEVARRALEGSGFAGFEIVVQSSNIPEARNICIERMVGEALLFWDSDVLMERTAVSRLVGDLGKCDIVSAKASQADISRPEEINDILERIDEGQGEPGGLIAVPAVAMGHTLIHRKVFEAVRFDPELPFGEDADFCIRARERGYSVCVDTGVRAFDVNVGSSRLSDIYVYSPVLPQLKSLRKRARAKVYGLDFEVGVSRILRYLYSNKRYVFYLGYALSALLLIAGLLTPLRLLAVLLPLQLLLYFLLQLRRRGFSGALRATVLSLVVGTPLTVLMLYYSLKESLKRFALRLRRSRIN